MILKLKFSHCFELKLVFILQVTSLFVFFTVTMLFALLQSK